jgi:hypothetical protein
LKIFELAPKSKGMTSFAARWDEKEDALDIDIQEVSSVDEFWFIHEKHGYVGHHSTRALNNTASIYTYNVLIRTPQERIFEAMVSFTAVRRVGISGTARIITASREEKIFDQEILGQYPPWAFGEKQAFCAACQTVTMQTFAVDRNNEIVVTCRCSRFLKFPLTETQEQLDALLEAHQKANQGQVRA